MSLPPGVAKLVHQSDGHRVAANAEHNRRIDRRCFRRSDYCARHYIEQVDFFPLEVSRRFFSYFQIALGVANDQGELFSFLQTKFSAGRNVTLQWSRIGALQAG